MVRAYDSLAHRDRAARCREFPIETAAICCNVAFEDHVTQDQVTCAFHQYAAAADGANRAGDGFAIADGYAAQSHIQGCAQHLKNPVAGHSTITIYDGHARTSTLDNQIIGNIQVPGHCTIFQTRPCHLV